MIVLKYLASMRSSRSSGRAYIHMSCGLSWEDVRVLNVEVILLGYPETGLGLCAQKDAEGFAEAMSLRKVPRKV